MTLHYHGGPITPFTALAELAGRCFCVSYARPDQVRQMHELGQSVMLDNGAFSVWRRGMKPDWPGYYRWCEKWLDHSTTWAVIPDVIDGTEEENDRLVREWPFGQKGAPVWHMHEGLDWLGQLALWWDRICIGSSGAYAQLQTPQWHHRMQEVFNVLCDDRGVPTVKIHMLRGLALADGPYPFHSLDSTNLAQNHARDGGVRAKAELWDSKQCPPRWERIEQTALEVAS